MTTQTSNTAIGNNSVSRIFNVTATDKQYNNSIDTISSTALGLALPGVTINSIASTYTSGLGVWRIIRSQTGLIVRQGFMSVGGQVDPAECAIIPYTIQPDDLFQVYTDIADTTPGQSTVLALVTTPISTEAFTATNVVDAEDTALLSLIAGLGIGDLFFGRMVTGIQIMTEDGGSVGNFTITDASGGIQYTAYGQKRLPTAGGQSNQTNLVAMTNFPVAKGWVLKVKVTSS